jgi:hypothetical protein
MELSFKIIAAALFVVAAYFLWAGNVDGVFVSVVLGAVSFLLSLRFQIKARMKQRTPRDHSGDQDL